MLNASNIYPNSLLEALSNISLETMSMDISEPAKSATAFVEGMYKVGVDVPSEKYMIIAQNGVRVFFY